MPSPPECVIVCPLRFEQKTLRRMLGKHFDLRCSGWGGQAMTDWCRHFNFHEDIPPLVILAGLAGGLRKDIRVGDAYFASQVIEVGTSKCWETPGDSSPCIIASTTAITLNPKTKGVLHQTTGADLVDLESAAFAAAATEFGWSWAIARGVSDGPEDTLPECISGWTSSTGGLRSINILKDIVLRRTTIPEMIRLRRNGNHALREVAIIIRNHMAKE